MTPPLRASCDGCGCWTGARHSIDCARAVCEATGLQWLDCACPKDAVDGRGTQMAPNGFLHQVGRFQGAWVFEFAAHRTGMWIRWNPDALFGVGRWERCMPNEPGAGPDITRITTDAMWDPRLHEWRLRRGVLYARLSLKQMPDPISHPQLMEQGTIGDEDVLEWVAGQFDLAAYPLRLWALGAGVEVVAELYDVDRIGKGWKAALAVPAEVIAVNDQRDLGGTNAVRRKSIATAKEAGRLVLSRSMWEDVDAAPESEKLRWSNEARAVMGPEPD